MLEGGDYMKSAQCGYARYITPVYAASIILMTLLKVEKKIEVFTFSGTGSVSLDPYTVPAVPDIDNLVTSLQTVNIAKVLIFKIS